MTDNATGLGKDVTVVLLGHEEQGYRERALHYYKTQGLACAVVEHASSNLTGDACTQGLQALLSQLATPFVSLALDTDFVRVQALEAAAEHLHAHPQCQLAQGYVLGHAPGSKQVAYHKIGDALDATVGENARVAIEQYAASGQSAWRALVRGPTLQAVLATLPAGLDFDTWLVVVSYSMLGQGALKRLDQTDALVQYAESRLSQVEREEQRVRAVRVLRQWDADHLRLCADDEGFTVIDRFVGATQGGVATDLLFTSTWSGMNAAPERRFEPRQFVELPYYNAPLFEVLTGLEFLLHAWPVGQAHRQAVEGTWVSQFELLREHPNDTVDTLRARYWQALDLGVFTPEVCRRLLATLVDEDVQADARELQAWLERLDGLPGIDPAAWLRATASGLVQESIAAATPDAATQQRIVAHLSKQRAAQIAFVVVDLEDDNGALQNTFDSLLASGLRDFKLVVLKAGKPPVVTTPRDTLHFIQVTPGNFVSHLNQVARQVPSEWLLLLQAGDLLTVGGLLRLQVELASAPGCLAICANEVQRDSDGRLVSVVRQGGNLDLLRSRPDLMSQHWLVRREAVVELGGYSETYPQAVEFDLLLRLVEHNGLNCLAHMDEYLVIGRGGREGMAQDALSTLNRHLAALGYRGQVNDAGEGQLQIDFRHQSTPLVSILIAADDDLEQLKACVVSVLQRTRYPRYEVLVACRDTLADLTVAALQGFGGRVKLLAGEHVQSASQLINLAAVNASGEYLVLLSSRCQVVTPAWIEALLNQAQRPEVGVVGARLVDREAAISHAGYELLAGAQVQSPWLGVSTRDSKASLWSGVVRSCAAVSADCLMVRKALFEQCDGLSAEGGADIELCLKAADAGLLVIWAPQAQLLSDQVPMPDAQACQALEGRWPAAFSSRVIIDGRFGVDVSRSVAAGGSPVLEWLADLG
ncbi:glycosyl transferase [Pseudomonas sp. MF6396]|uniref:glycosyltransferase n=1 Tax=Pseudomonas sp. MF6396 TaxID=1960828 RepID=UPI000996EFDA|nr:glycosyltransferase [Pseudomonas sp. MF6396]OOW03498.1 glycosyl transferase [Pseudomonas sp. MF6396]